MWFYLPTVSPLWHTSIPFCNIPVFLLPLFICLLFQVSPALPIVCHTPVFLLLPLPYFVSVILFASPPPSPTCYVWLHTLYTTILFSGFSPHLLYICYNSIFQLSHLYYSPPPLYTTTPSTFFSPFPVLCLWFYLPPTTTCMTPFPLQQCPVFALILFPNFVSFIIVTDVSVW